MTDDHADPTTANGTGLNDIGLNSPAPEPPHRETELEPGNTASSEETAVADSQILDLEALTAELDEIEAALPRLSDGTYFNPATPATQSEPTQPGQTEPI